MFHVLLKMNTENSWSRCAKEFSSIIDYNVAEDGDERLFSRYDTKKKLNANNNLLYRKNVVATDVALANIEVIESSELVSRWIADGIRTPPLNSEENAVSQSTEPISELEKSPVINCRRRSVRTAINGNKRRQKVVSPDLNKSPVIGSSTKLFKKRRKKFDLYENGLKKESRQSLNVDRSLIFGSRDNHSLDNIVGKNSENITSLSSCGFLFVDVDRSSSPPANEKRCLTSFDFEAVLNEGGYLRGFRKLDDDFQKILDNVNEKNFRQYEDDVLSQDIFDDYEEPRETITIDKELTTEEENDLVSRLGLENCFEEGEKILGYTEPNNSPSTVKNSSKEYNPEKDSCKIELASDESSSSSFIRDTEELFPLFVPGENHADKRGEELLVIDSELSQVKNDFVQDTEKIDYDTSSDSNNSDRTVSDIIEEPLTQDCVEISKKKIDQPSSSFINSISAPSLKISGTISVDISVDATPPKEQESFARIPELNFSSTKKKKSRVKKGSLSARLRKLVDGDVSSVRLWRHQMSHDPVFQNSSTPFTVLSVIEHSVKCDINFYRSKVIEDPFDLLKLYYGDEIGDRVKNLVVITRSEFTGRVTLPSGTIFNLYTPWKVYNNDHTKRGKRDLIIHALYFKIISLAGKFNNKAEEENFNRSCKNVEISKNNYQIVKNDYHNCPCLINNKIDDSCTSKFNDDQKVNLMNVILYNNCD